MHWCVQRDRSAIWPANTAGVWTVNVYVMQDGKARCVNGVKAESGEYCPLPSHYTTPLYLHTFLHLIGWLGCDCHGGLWYELTSCRAWQTLGFPPVSTSSPSASAAAAGSGNLTLIVHELTKALVACCLHTQTNTRFCFLYVCQKNWGHVKKTIHMMPSQPFPFIKHTVLFMYFIYLF